jgi:hypothetical protein
VRGACATRAWRMLRTRSAADAEDAVSGGGGALDIVRLGRPGRAGVEDNDGRRVLAAAAGLEPGRRARGRQLGLRSLCASAAGAGTLVGWLRSRPVSAGRQHRRGRARSREAQARAILYYTTNRMHHNDEENISRSQPRAQEQNLAKQNTYA